MVRRSPADIEAAMEIARVRDRRYRIPFKRGTCMRREMARRRWRRAAQDLGFFPPPDPDPPSRELTLENLLKHTEEHPQLPVLHPGSKFWKWGQYETRELMALYRRSQCGLGDGGEWTLPPLTAV